MGTSAKPPALLEMQPRNYNPEVPCVDHFS